MRRARVGFQAGDGPCLLRAESCSLRRSLLELKMRLVYACRFEIPDDSAYEQILDAYQSWINHHYSKKRGIDGFFFSLYENNFDGKLLSEHVLSSKTHKTDCGEACAIEWSYPDNVNDTLKWRNFVRLGRVRGASLVEHSIFIQSIDYQISPARVLLGSPSVVRKLCSGQTVRVGEMRIQATPYYMSEFNVDDFVNLLQGELRRVSVVFLSPYANGKSNLIDGSNLAQSLAGVAIVVIADDLNGVWKMVSQLGRQASCFDGGARIYWPSFSVHDDPRRHPLYLGREIQGLGPEQNARLIERTIFSVASFRFVPDPRISEVIRISEAAARVSEIEFRKESAGSSWEKYALELDEKYQCLLQEYDNLKSENENLKQNQQIVFASYTNEVEAEVRIFEKDFIPKSAHAAVVHASEACRDLEILDSALAAAKDSPFQRPDEILDALHDLNDISKLSNDEAVDIQDQLLKRGWGKRCSMKISRTTRNKFESDYSFKYKGEVILFEPHITIGAGDPGLFSSLNFEIGFVIPAEPDM